MFLTWSSISKRITRITYLLLHTLAPDKIEIKREMSEYQLKIADLDNIRIGNVIKLVPTFFVKVCALLWKFTTLLKTRIKTKKTHRVLEFNQSQWLKPYIEFNTWKRIEGEKNKDKDGKALYKLMNNGKCEKQNRCEASKQWKRLFKVCTKSNLYAAQNIWH